MLHTLSFWRQQCDAAQLAAFEQQLEPVCATTIKQNTLQNCYHGSYHQALVNSKCLRAAIQMGERDKKIGPWSYGLDLGQKLTQTIASLQGCVVCDAVAPQFQQALALLLERGVLFDYEGYYHLPIECILELRNKDYPASWLTQVCEMVLPILVHIIPADVKATMQQPAPTYIEAASWLAVQGEKARHSDYQAQLSDVDWSLLLDLQHSPITSFDKLQKHYPELQPVSVDSAHFYSDKLTISFRRSLEASVPEALCKLCRLGLVTIAINRGNRDFIAVNLCSEAKELLTFHWQQAHQHQLKHIEEQWLATPCQEERPSPWSMDQQIWRIWTALHFLPLGITQQGDLRKKDSKKIALVLNMKATESIGFFILSLQTSGLLQQQQDALQPVAIDWPAWSKRMRESIYQVVRGWEPWDSEDQEQATALLAALPTKCWLKLENVIDWLRMQSEGNLATANWLMFFTEHQYGALHHYNSLEQSIYLLPLFRNVIKQQQFSLPAPGWRGANKDAKIHGFISAAGEIQLPPDCKHTILHELARFCTLTSVEQMITLQLDVKALQRMGTDKKALATAKKILVSIQSPLPQPIVYLFEKQQAQKPIASVAATSMALLIHEPKAILSLKKSGYPFSQPFKERPEFVLLEASVDAQAFLHYCKANGILLETLIPPIAWITSTVSINAWMQVDINRTNQWLEICYQKARNSKPKQLFARIEYDYYGKIEVRPLRKSKQGQTLLKSLLTLEPKHLLRLRELDDIELKELALDGL
ncbi:MAG: hypothetical protein Q9M31_00730 [Mariprofundus sp.]|nr:hypothetical protein [Mariprofundus sp.]